jgi:hypothetical protein
MTDVVADPAVVVVAVDAAVDLVAHHLDSAGVVPVARQKVEDLHGEARQKEEARQKGPVAAEDRSPVERLRDKATNWIL